MLLVLISQILMRLKNERVINFGAAVLGIRQVLYSIEKISLLFCTVLS